ncbi:MAG: 50S ribosomal protein L29 [Patescibacteria group bacterium]|jgi:ribosomal protein L29
MARTSKELGAKSIAELHALLAETREKLRDARFRVAAKQLKDVREVRQLRATVARILTTLNKKKPVTTASRS